MANKTTDRIAIENVVSPGRQVRVDAVKYEAMKRAMLATLVLGAPGMTLAALKAAVLRRLPQDLFPRGDKAGWWLKAVQLDLEAKGVLGRDGGKPLRLSRRE
jgi:hypothetical protein